MHRNDNLDVLKGLGILLVVIGHSEYVLRGKGELFNLIYSVHMPLFFLISGVFFL